MKRKKKFQEKHPRIRKQRTKSDEKSVWHSLERDFWLVRAKTYKQSGYTYESLENYFRISLAHKGITEDDFENL